MALYESSDLIRSYYTCNKCSTDDFAKESRWIHAEHIEEKFKPYCLYCGSSDLTKFKRERLTYFKKGSYKFE